MVPFDMIRLWDVAIFAEQIPQELLNVFGWTKQQYESELLERIDRDFEELCESCLSN
jgi:hypothetical protein